MPHITIKNINDIKEEKLNNFYPTIKQHKKEKIAKIKNSHNQKLSILGEYILAQDLKRYYKVDYQTINFKYNQNNKPYIQNKNIFFNISHSHDYVAVITGQKECGIDIEKIRDVNLSVIKVFANRNEQKFILEKDSITRLFQIYCLKEAYIKMKGDNLSKLKDVEFTIKDKKIVCSDIKVKCKLKYHQDMCFATCERL